MRLSIRAYAKRRGVSAPAVRKAIQTGRITREPDGTINPVKADRDWAANTMPGLSGDAANMPAVDVLDALLLGVGGIAPGMTLVEARTANEIMKAQERQLNLDKLRGELIDRNKALALVCSLGRQGRDAWVNWPVRVAALFAAEIGADVHAVQNCLDKYVRAHLAEMPDIEINL